ncbi:MAG: tetratricopeptide repeat protein [Bacillota bacterium]|jgi:TPR repeat protein
MTKKTSIICFFIAALMFAGSLVFSQEAACSKEDLPVAKLLFDNRDGTLAFQIFTELARTGDAEAIAWLGRCYFNGIGVNVDDGKAFTLFSKAAEMGEPWAINGMGVCYNYGRGTTKNLRLAIESYRKAAAMNHPLATLNLARTLGFKDDGFYDPKTADDIFKKAVALKAPGAELSYGTFLFQHQRYSEAIHFLEASGDNASALRMLIQCYNNGWGTPIDIRKAVRLAADYATVNPLDAIFGAEVIYEAAWEEVFFNGRTEWFANYIKQAANYGHNEAQIVYANILKEQNDIEEAFNFARRAAEANVYGANLEAGTLAKQLKNYDIALKYLNLATLEPDSEQTAIDNLVDIYAYQLGQRPKSRHWAQRGAELGSAYCRNELADEALSMKTPESLAKAYVLIYASHIDGNDTATDWIGRNLKDDYETLRELADNGNVDALVALGLLGALNDKGHPNIHIGFELLEKAAGLKSGVACRYLGNLYFNGVVLDKDLQKAFEWYKKGAELGDATCAHSVVSMLFNDKEFADIPFEECKKWCDLSMRFDDSSAYMYGRLCEYKGKDVESAKKLYEIAALNYNPKAMIVLHDMLWDKEAELSISYLRKAVELHDDLALYRFGMMNRLAMGQPRKAFIAYVKANIAGDNTTAPYEIACCLLKGIGCSVNTNMALKMAETAFQNGEPQSCSLLGGLYRDGIVVPKNEAKAKQYFEEGVKRGDTESKKALGIPIKE